MQGVDDFLDAVKRAAEAGMAANREIVVRCGKHGEFTRGDLNRRDMRDDECPECYAERRAEADRDRRLREALRHFEQHSGVPLRFQPASLENYIPPTEQAEAILATLKSYTTNFEKYRAKGLSLILCGTTGTGKTHLACAVLKGIASEHGISGLYDTAYKAIQKVRATYRSHEESEQQAVERYIAPALLVLDEIGVQYGTDSEKLILFSILNGRYEEMKPSLLVSNLTVDEIIDYLGDRVFDRMRENGGAVLAFNWTSHRQRRP